MVRDVQGEGGFVKLGRSDSSVADEEGAMKLEWLDVGNLAMFGSSPTPRSSAVHTYK